MQADTELDVLDNLRQFWKSLEGRDAFDRLGLEKPSNDTEVRQNYFQLVKRFHPDLYLRHKNPEIIDLLTNINSSLREAYDLLSTDKKREEYLQLGSSAVSSVDLETIFALEKSLDQGKVLFERGEFSLALEKLVPALELTPEDPQLLGMIHYSEFMALPVDERGIRSQSEVNVIISKLEDLAQKHKKNQGLRIHLGYIMKLSNKQTEALKFFNIVNEMSNGENPTALREMRLIQDRQRKAEESSAYSSIFSRIKSLFAKSS